MVGTNLTNLTNANNVVEQIVAVNDLSGGLFMIMILIAVFVVLYIVRSGDGVQNSLFVASFCSFILGVLFVFMGVVNFSVVLPFLALTIITFAMLMLSD